MERLNHRMPVMVGKPCVKFLMNCIMNSDLPGEEERPRGVVGRGVVGRGVIGRGVVGC
jgi:hypothetical protein